MYFKRGYYYFYMLRPFSEVTLTMPLAIGQLLCQVTPKYSDYSGGKGEGDYLR